MSITLKPYSRPSFKPYNLQMGSLVNGRLYKQKCWSMWVVSRLLVSQIEGLNIRTFRYSKLLLNKHGANHWWMNQRWIELFSFYYLVQLNMLSYKQNHTNSDQLSSNLIIPIRQKVSCSFSSCLINFALINLSVWIVLCGGKLWYNWTTNNIGG